LISYESARTKLTGNPLKALQKGALQKLYTNNFGCLEANRLCVYCK